MLVYANIPFFNDVQLYGLVIAVYCSICMHHHWIFCPRQTIFDGGIAVRFKRIPIVHGYLVRTVLAGDSAVAVFYQHGLFNVHLRRFFKFQYSFCFFLHICAMVVVICPVDGYHLGVSKYEKCLFRCGGLFCGF